MGDSKRHHFQAFGIRHDIQLLKSRHDLVVHHLLAGNVTLESRRLNLRCTLLFGQTQFAGVLRIDEFLFLDQCFELLLHGHNVQVNLLGDVFAGVLEHEQIQLGFCAF